MCHQSPSFCSVETEGAALFRVQLRKLFRVMRWSWEKESRQSTNSSFLTMRATKLSSVPPQGNYGNYYYTGQSRSDKVWENVLQATVLHSPSLTEDGFKSLTSFFTSNLHPPAVLWHYYFSIKCVFIYNMGAATASPTCIQFRCTF